MEKIIKTSKSLGILGGGQLGKFFTIAAKNMGYSVVVFDPDKQSPAGKISDKHICKPYDDLKALDELKKICSAVTTEFENVPAATLKYLEKDIIVRPSSKAISIAQNRIKEKDFLRNIKPKGLFPGIPIGTYVVIDSIKSINNIDEELGIFPGILKTAQFGYDGKGQIHVNNKIELQDAFKTFNSAPCTLESKIELEYECSVVLARSVHGKFEVYPVITNHHESGILDTSFIQPVPTNGTGPEMEIGDYMIMLSKRVADELNYVGVMAVEWFAGNGGYFINEIAPRPHNSGHFSIDTCLYNQFDQQVLTLVGEEPKNIGIKVHTSLMLNLLGDLWFRHGELREPKFELIEAPGVILHLYGKAEPRIGRKMGHITILVDKNQALKDIKNNLDTLRKTLWEN